MPLDTTLNLPTLVTLGLSIIGLIAWFVRLEGRVTANANGIAELFKARDDDSTKFGAMEGLVRLTREQFQQYRTEVAEKYATTADISDMKRDIVTEIGKMESRVEQQITRLVEARP